MAKTKTAAVAVNIYSHLLSRRRSCGEDSKTAVSRREGRRRLQDGFVKTVNAAKMAYIWSVKTAKVVKMVKIWLLATAKVAKMAYLLLVTVKAAKTVKNIAAMAAAAKAWLQDGR
jgi:hypothetical protein